MEVKLYKQTIINGELIVNCYDGLAEWISEKSNPDINKIIQRLDGNPQPGYQPPRWHWVVLNRLHTKHGRCKKLLLKLQTSLLNHPLHNKWLSHPRTQRIDPGTSQCHGWGNQLDQSPGHWTLKKNVPLYFTNFTVTINIFVLFNFNNNNYKDWGKLYICLFW